MTKREMTSLLIKLMGIYALVQLVPGIVQAMAMFASGAYQFTSQPGMVALVLLMSVFAAPLMWIWLCIWLIRKSDRFAERLYPVDAPAGQLTTLGAKDVRRLGYHFIGLMLVIKSLPPLLMILYQLIMLYRLPYEQRYPMSGYSSQWIVLLLQLAIGLYLFLYPKGLANLWIRLQNKLDPNVNAPQ